MSAFMLSTFFRILNVHQYFFKTLWGHIFSCPRCVQLPQVFSIKLFWPFILDSSLQTVQGDIHRYVVLIVMELKTAYTMCTEKIKDDEEKANEEIHTASVCALSLLTKQTIVCVCVFITYYYYYGCRVLMIFCLQSNTYKLNSFLMLIKQHSHSLLLANDVDDESLSLAHEIIRIE